MPPEQLKQGDIMILKRRTILNSKYTAVLIVSLLASLFNDTASAKYFIGVVIFAVILCSVFLAYDFLLTQKQQKVFSIIGAVLLIAGFVFWTFVLPQLYL